MQTKYTMPKLDPAKEVPTNKHVSLRRSLINEQRPYNIQEAREELASKKLFINQKKQLPEIQSPYLKKTVTTLFQYKSCQLSPSNLEEKAQFQKYSKSMLDQELKYETKAQKIFNSINFNDETNKKTNSQTRIKKSLSEIKPTCKASPYKSTPANTPIVNYAKVPTEQSTSSGYSKQIYDKLTQVDLLPPFNPSKSPQKQIAQNIANKNCKNSIFAIKHKLAQSLYSQERQEIKMVQNILASKHHGKVGQSIKIKNYTKFLPNVIHIET